MVGFSSTKEDSTPVTGAGDKVNISARPPSFIKPSGNSNNHNQSTPQVDKEAASRRGYGLYAPNPKNLRDTDSTEDEGFVGDYTEKYIPESMVKKHMERVIDDMSHMKENHNNIMYKMDSQYRKIEDETQSFYVNVIDELKTKASERLQHYKLHLQRTECIYVNYKQDMENKVESLNDIIQYELKEKNRLIMEFNDERNDMQAKHTDMIDNLKECHEKEHTRMVWIHTMEIEARACALATMNELSCQLEMKDQKEQQHVVNTMKQQLETLRMKLNEQSMDSNEQLQNLKKVLYATQFQGNATKLQLIKKVDDLLKSSQEQQKELADLTVLKIEVEGQLHEKADKLIKVEKDVVHLTKTYNREKNEKVKAEVHGVLENLVGKVEENELFKKDEQIYQLSKQLNELQFNIVGHGEQSKIQKKLKEEHDSIVLDLKNQILELEGKMKAHADNFSAEEVKRNKDSDKLTNLMNKIAEIGKNILHMEESIIHADEETENAELQRKEKKTECKKWIADFENENGRPPEASDKEAVRHIFKDLKKCDKVWNQAKENSKDLKMKLENLQMDKEKLEEELKQMKDRLALGVTKSSSSASFSNIDSVEFKGLQTKCTSLETENKNLTFALDLLETTLSESGNEGIVQKVIDLETALSVKVEEIANLQQALSSSDNQQPKPIQNAWGEKTQEVDALETKVSTITKELEGSQEEVLHLKTNEKKLTKSLQDYEKRIAALENEVHEMEKAASAGNANEHLENKIEKMRKEIQKKSNATKAGWDAAADAEEKLEKEIIRVKKETIEKMEEKLNAEKEELKGKFQTIVEEFHDTKDKLESQTSKNSELEDELSSLERKLEDAKKKLKLLEEQFAVEKQLLELQAQQAGGSGGTSSGIDYKDLQQKYKASEKMMHKAIKQGTQLWQKNQKNECFKLYQETAKQIQDTLPEGDECRKILETALVAAEKQLPPRGAVTLRKAYDTYLKGTGEFSEKMKNMSQRSSTVSLHGGGGGGGEADALQARLASLKQSDATLEIQSALDEVTKKYNDAQNRIKELEQELEDAQNSGENNNNSSKTNGDNKKSPTNNSKTPAVRGNAGGASNSNQAKEITTLKKKAKEDAMTIRKLEKQLEAAKEQASKASANSSSANDTKVLERKMAEAEKKHKKAFDEAEKKSEQTLKKVNKELKETKDELGKTKEELETTTKERNDFKKKAGALGGLEEEMTKLRARADEATELENAIKAKDKEVVEIEKMWKIEQTKRRALHNELEDLKGNIRVFARCRPFAQYEKDKGCEQVVRFVDEETLEVMAARGPKSYTLNAAFTPTSTQDEVFDQAKRLVQSAIDGFNVCIFAYGQTGSGKTWTMRGIPSNPGLIPRSISEVFDILNDTQHISFKVSTYFVELYNDHLNDLYWLLDHNPKRETPPKLEIKYDGKKAVHLKNSIIKEAASAEELLHLFEEGDAKRKTGATKMNAGSSRSHSIFAILLAVTNQTTKKTMTGKLSLVDLAGSERAEKTGATGDTLEEAKHINQSLSALSNVIAGLAQNEKFIRYRDNKLTMVMQDSLGGTAKTLMFVNISPADYNTEETIISLSFAMRVKMITNDASKQGDSEEVSRLKAMIKKLKAGQALAEEEEDAVDV